MLSISLIIIISLVLFLYWFRYSCLLILEGKASFGTASPGGLGFPSVLARIKTAGNEISALDQLGRALDKDYRIVCFLLRCTPDAELDAIERRMLMLDYNVMQAWYRVARRVAPPQARRALDEMSCIVLCFAYSVNRQSEEQHRASA